MKKIIFMAVAGFISLASCSNSDEPQVEQFGTISLGMSADITVSTRAVTALTPEQLANYQITLNKSGVAEAIKSGTYQNLFPTGNTMLVSTGTGYTLTAANCTDADAESANNGQGQIQYKGTSNEFEVKANLNTDVTVNCKVANAQVSVTWDNSIANSSAFSELKAVVYENSNADRQFTFTNDTANDPHPFFNIDEDPKLVGTITYKFNGNEKNYTITDIALAPAKHIKLAISASTNSGQITVTITVDDTVEEENHPIEINPYV